MHACIYCVYIYSCVCMHVYMSAVCACAHVSMYVPLFVHRYAYVFMYVYLCLCTRVSMFMNLLCECAHEQRMYYLSLCIAHVCAYMWYLHGVDAHE